VTATVEGFLVEYPEFTPLHAEDEPLVTAVLARAERRIGSAWPEEVRDDIVYLQMADTLARTPMGRNANLSAPGEPTTYSQDLKCRKKAFACGRSRVV
jgi:hypothetical protein